MRQKQRAFITFVFIASLLLLFSWQQEKLVYGQANLLVNSGFESGVTSWDDIGGNPPVVTSNAYSGTSSLMLGTGAGGRAQTISGEHAGEFYTLSGWGKLLASNDIGYIGAAFYDSANTKISQEAIEFTGNTTYEQKAISFMVPANTARMAVWEWVDGTTNNFYVDDLSLTSAQGVTSLTLINTDAEQDIQELKNGDTIVLNSLPTQNLNIGVNTNPSTVGSVKICLDSKCKTENGAPYAYGTNSGTTYEPIPPNELAVGQHTITVTPYTATNLGGTAGVTSTVTFTISNQTAPCPLFRLAREVLPKQYLFPQ